MFIHNIDAPVPRAIARLLAHTPIGIRKASEEDAEEEPEGGSVSAKPTYEIIGTLSAAGEKFKEASNQDESRPGTALSQPRQETPGRKYLANRKGQLPVADRYYPPGTVMPWISRVIPVGSELVFLFNCVLIYLVSGMMWRRSRLPGWNAMWSFTTFCSRIRMRVLLLNI